MESFVTRIGDVTIERVLPKTSPEIDKLPADASGSGDQVTFTPTSTPITPSTSITNEDGTKQAYGSEAQITSAASFNTGESAPADFKEEPHDGAGAPSAEKSGTSNLDPHVDPGPGPGPGPEPEAGIEGDPVPDGSDVEMKPEHLNEVGDPEPAIKDEYLEDEEEEYEDELDDALDDDQMSAQSGEENDGDGEAEDDEEDDEGDGDGDAEDEDDDDDDALMKLAEAVSRGEVKVEDDEDPQAEAEGEGEAEAAGPDPEGKKKVRKRKKRKMNAEEGPVGSDPEKKKKKRKRIRKKKKGTGKDGEEEGDKGASSEDGSASGDETGEKKKKKKGKKGKKKKKSENDDDKSGDEETKKKHSNMRRNIREVMDETQLDEATIAAQRQEMERLRRVQEQQRLIREYQRQMAQTRQNSKTEQRVLSLLQGNTSIVKQVAGTGTTQSSASGFRGGPNTILVKHPGGQSPQPGNKVVELLRVPKGTTALPTKPGAALKPSVTRTLVSKPRSLTGTQMMTPSVSIAPVRSAMGTPASGLRPMAPLKSPAMPPLGHYSGSEEEDEEEDEEEEEMLETEEPPVVGKKGKKDVVTISSSSSSEDCIVLSEPSDAGEEEEEEDPTNSGMHTNDLYNVPDEEGRVQVNMGKPEGDPDIFLAPHIARIIKPHQIGGIRFLYDNVVESIERFNVSPGFGCILAHSMGLGKTLQVISFCDIFLRHTPAKTVLCIMPINTLQNWMAEFNMWLPKDPANSPLAAHGEVRARSFSIHVLNDSHKTLKARAKIVKAWTEEGGVLLIGYEMYRLLSLKRSVKPKKSRRKKPIEEDETLDPEAEEKRDKEMLEAVHAALVKPGPDLVICDEGHRIKNSHASISLALKQIRSKRRVVLTGYPLQNNLLEYWCMVDFVRPNYLGTKTEFCNMFERPIQNGQCIDSTPQDIRLMRYRAHVLHSLLEGFVQRRSHAVLQMSLPQKEEYVLLVRMTSFQRKLYDTFMNEVVRTKAVPNPLKAFAVCCKIWNHPDVLYQFLRKREGGEGVDLDLEEAAASIAPTTVDTNEPMTTVPPEPVPAKPRRPAKPRTRNPAGAGGGRSRKKKEPAVAKPAAAVMPNTSSQPADSNNVFPGASSTSPYPPISNQMNQNPMMSPYDPYPPTPGHSQYQSSFSNMPHHYPNSNEPYGYNSGGFSGSNMGMNNQGNFPNANVGYGDCGPSTPVPNQGGSFDSSQPPMFPPASQPSTPSSSQGYNSSYFPGTSNSSSQHGMGENFQGSSSYGQDWSNSSNYNFNPPQQGSQTFSGQNYNVPNQTAGFQGYGNPGGTGSGFYNPPSSNTSSSPASSATATSTSAAGTSTAGNGSSGGYQQGMMGQTQPPPPPNNQGMMGQAPPPPPQNNQGMMGQAPPPPQPNNPGMMGQAPPPPPQNNQPGMMMGNQAMMGNHNQQRMMVPPSPVNSSGMLPGGAPSREFLMPGREPRRRRVEGSPVNASGMLPGGAPTKDLMMPGKNQGLVPDMSSNMGPRMVGNMLPSMGSNMGGLGPGMDQDGMLPHHGQDMGMYSSQNMMGNQPLPSLGGSDVPTAEDLLRSKNEDFTPFDGSVDNMMSGMNDNKADMYGIKSDPSRMYDPWTNSHPQGYGNYKPLDSGLKHENSYTDLKPIGKIQKSDNDDLPLGPGGYDDMKGDLDESNPGMDMGHSIDGKGIDVDGKQWQVDSMEMVDKDKNEEGKEGEEEEPILDADGKPPIEIAGPGKALVNNKEDPGIPYDWAVELMKDYVPGLIENSAKMAIFFCILEESLALGDRILVFSQSLFTLSLIEEYLQRNNIPLPGVSERWQRNKSYYRLDGSTAALEREKLINEFNANPGVHIFLVSTRAGSLGINLVGANRVIVFDASWNPCHDTQAVCRVYRYGQKKQCFVYRLVMDNCLEKKIYDRQINKQGMADRVVDECNPDAHLSIKEVTNLCWDDEKDTEIEDFAKDKEKYKDIVMQKILEKHGKLFSKPPFQHESLLVDRKDKKLSQAEKRLAKRSYEMEKRANNRPVYHYYNAGAQGGLQISRAVQRDAQGNIVKPIASVRPMQAELNSGLERGPGGILRQAQPGRNKWIPAEVWQRQGMTAQEMTLPLDVVIPTNSPDRTSIVLKAGQRVMVLKSPKGIYMQLESGKIIAIRTAFKMGGNKGDGKMGPGDKDDMKKGMMNKSKLPSGIHPLRNNPNITITPRGSPGAVRSGIRPNVLQTRAVPTRLTSPAGRGWQARPGLAGRGVTVRPTGPGAMRPGLRPISPSVTVTPTLAKTLGAASVTISPRPVSIASKMSDDTGEASSLPGSQTDSLGGSRPTSQAGSEDGQNSNSSQDMSNHSRSLKESLAAAPHHETDELTEGAAKAWMDEEEDRLSHPKTNEDDGSQNYLDAALSSHSQSSTFTTGSDYAVDASRADRSEEAIGAGLADVSISRVGDSERRSPTTDDVSKLPKYRHSTSRQNSIVDPSLGLPGPGNDSFRPGEKMSADKPFGGNMFGRGRVESQVPANSFASFGGGMRGQDEEDERSRPRKSPAANRARKMSQYLEEAPAPSNMDSPANQWKGPQPFSPGVTTTSTKQRSLESPAMDDNSNTSANSAMSTKSSSANPPSDRLQPSNPPTPTSSAGAPLPPGAAPMMDPYLYGGYGSYPPSGYYSPSPYGHPVHQQPYPPPAPGPTPGFFPDRNAPPPTAAPPAATATAPASAPAPPPSSIKPETESPPDPAASRHQSNSSKSSSPADVQPSKKISRARSDVPAPTAYDSRTTTATSSTSTSVATPPTTSVEGSTYPSSSPSANPYNPIMMSPPFSSSTYPPPAPAAPPTAGSANLFSAAAANYPSPYPAAAPSAAPYGYAGANQFDPDFARASMYSAFHRPDPGQFPGAAPAPLDPAAPYLPPLPGHTRPINPAYPQNVYPGQFSGARDPYAPYSASPFMMGPGPYGGLPAPPSTTPSTSTTDHPQTQ